MVCFFLFLIQLYLLMQQMRFQSLGWEDPLEGEVAPHFSTLAWKIPWTEEPGGLSSRRVQRVSPDYQTEHTLEHTCTTVRPLVICYRLSTEWLFVNMIIGFYKKTRLADTWQAFNTYSMLRSWKICFSMKFCLHLYNFTPWQETRVHLKLSFSEVALELLSMNPRDQARYRSGSINNTTLMLLFFELSLLELL